MAEKSFDEKCKAFDDVMGRLEENIIKNALAVKVVPDNPVDPVSLLKNPDNAEVLTALVDGKFGTQGKALVSVIAKVIKDQGLEDAYKLSTTPKREKITPPNFVMCVLQKSHCGFKAGTTILLGNSNCFDLFMNQSFTNGQYNLKDFSTYFRLCNEDEIRSNIKKLRMLGDIDIDHIFDASGFKTLSSMVLPRKMRIQG